MTINWVEVYAHLSRTNPWAATPWFSFPAGYCIALEMVRGLDKVEILGNG